MICSNCGNYCPDGMAFCPSCRARIVPQAIQGQPRSIGGYEPHSQMRSTGQFAVANQQQIAPMADNSFGGKLKSFTSSVPELTTEPPLNWHRFLVNIFMRFQLIIDALVLLFFLWAIITYLIVLLSGDGGVDATAALVLSIILGSVWAAVSYWRLSVRKKLLEFRTDGPSQFFYLLLLENVPSIILNIIIIFFTSTFQGILGTAAQYYQTNAIELMQYSYGGGGIIALALVMIVIRALPIILNRIYYNKRTAYFKY